MLEGKLVSLRKLEPSDLAQLFKWNEEEELYLFKGRYKFISYDELKDEFLSYSLSQQIFLINKEHIQIGICSYWDVNWRDRHCEFYGEIYDREVNAENCLNESLSLLVSLLFDHENLFRVYAYVPESNSEIRSILEKLCFTLEGTFREHRFYDGRYLNTLVYSQLKDEYVSISSTVE